MRRRLLHILKAYWPSMVVGAGIVYLSLFHATSLHVDISHPDKLGHWLAYLVWTICLTGDLHRDEVSFGWRAVWAVLFPIVFGGIIELLQTYCFPPRTGEWLDWYADASGVVLGFVLVDVFYRCPPDKFRIGSYAQFYLQSRNTMGYGVHSPYLFYIARTLIPETTPYYSFGDIEHARQQLLQRQDIVRVTDYGTGGGACQQTELPVGTIARKALKCPREAQLLFRLVNHLNAQMVVELGTSLGITTAYLAKPHAEAQIVTFEGSGALLGIAKQNWAKLGIHNITAVEGNIDETLPREAVRWQTVDVAFLDANHRKEATLRYFDILAAHAGEDSLFVVDDIRHSREMWEAWQAICEREDVTARFDLGSMGLVFFNRHLPKQTFKIRM